MGNKVYTSTKEVLEARALEIKAAKESGNPIFTPDSYGAVIAVDEDLERRLTHSGLVHKDEEVEGATLDEEYTPTTFWATYNSIIRKMPEANKDEIFMFLATADPTRLADTEMQDALFTRLAEIQKTDMVKAVVEHKDPTEVAQANATEISTISSIFGAMKDAVKVGDSYYAAGFNLDEVQ